MNNLREYIEKILSSNPELNEDLFKALELEFVSDELKERLINAYYENVGARFFDDLWQNYLSQEQKELLDEILNVEPINQADVFNFLERYVPNWTEILLYNALMTKKDLLDMMKIIKEESEKIIKQKLEGQS
ncbi:MAG: hypothetical protein QXL14_02825 [Candidatus Aenigmatarchaeota archaeon]